MTEDSQQSTQQQSISVDQIIDIRHQHNDEIVDVNESLCKFVVCLLNEQYYAVPGSYVKEILPENTAIFPVPGCPSFLPGVINLRGEIESIIDICVLLQLDTTLANQKQTILMINSSAFRTGILVNQVIDVIDISESQLLPPPDNLSDVLRDYIANAFDFEKQLVTVLDMDKILQHYKQDL